MVSEILIRNLRKDAPRCPACGSANLEKLVSASCLVRTQISAPGTACCARTERCQAPRALQQVPAVEIKDSRNLW
ncbi:MAG: hypothetical protein KAW81_03270 [Dehalococcoidia bacterium]|nr:hypothetical protein [Dehalococcoidia bacterium]